MTAATGQRGIALPATIGVMVVVMVLVIALWTYASAERTQVDRTRRQMQAHFLACSAAEAVSDRLTSFGDPLKTLEYANRQTEVELDDGSSFSVDIAHLGDDGLMITATGTVGDVSESVRVTLEHLNDFAISANEVSLGSAAAEIYGDIISKSVDIHQQGTHAGEVHEYHIPWKERQFPDPIDLTRITEDELGDQMQSEGQYIIEQDSWVARDESSGELGDISLSGHNEQLVVQLGEEGSPQDVSLLVGDFTLSGAAQNHNLVELRGEGRFLLYVQGDFEATGNNNWIKSTGDDASVVVFMAEGSEFSASGVHGFRGMVYAPKADVTLTGTSEMDGMVVADTAELDGTTILRHYAPNNAEDFDLLPYRVNLWHD